MRSARRRLPPGRLPGCLAVILGALLAALPALSAARAAGQILPVAIAADAVGTDPEVASRDYQGHKAWSILWPRDAEGRELHLGFIETLRLPYRQYPQELVQFAHDDSSTDPAETSVDHGARAEIIWERDVFWLVMSERAVMMPDPAKPETMADGRLHRGDGRRHCAVFTIDPAPREGTLVGAYCRNLAAGVTVDAAAARQWLEDLDLTVTNTAGGVIRAD